MGKVAHLHKTEPVNASLAVLKSPDIPSVLVETGFISNPSEEKLLIQRSHQDKLARALATAIVQYFEDNPPEGTLFANRGKAQKHKVQRGESIGLIANQYGVSVDALKSQQPQVFDDFGWATADYSSFFSTKPSTCSCDGKSCRNGNYYPCGKNGRFSR